MIEKYFSFKIMFDYIIPFAILVIIVVIALFCLFCAKIMDWNEKRYKRMMKGNEEEEEE